MKRLKCIPLLLALLLLCACAGKEKPNTIKDGRSLDEVVKAVDAKFEETYGEGGAVSMAKALEKQELVELCGVAEADIDSYAGSYALSMTNSDRLIAVKAKQGRAEAVATALEKHRADLVAQYQFYNVMGSLDRAQAGEVLTKGDYVFLLVLGRLPEDPDASLHFDKDVDMAKQVINGMFH